MAQQTRSFFEPRIGYELSAVRIHTDSSANRSAAAIDARAYTLGNNIVFGNGEYSPDSDSGRHLLAHELAHVVQQSGSGPRGDGRVGQRNSLQMKGKADSAAGVPVVRAMSYEEAIAVLRGVLPETIDETTGAMNVIGDTLDMPSTMQNAGVRLRRLIAAFSLLDSDGAAVVYKTLTAPENKKQQHIKEHFGRLDHRFREPLLVILQQRAGGAVRDPKKVVADEEESQAKYQEGRATWVELHPGVFALVPEPGLTLANVAAYVSGNPELTAGLVKLNGLAADQSIPTGTPVMIPVELIDRDRAIGEMSRAIRSRIGSVLNGRAYAASAERLMRVGPGLRGPGMHGLFPVTTMALSPLASVVSKAIDALIAIVKGAAYGVSFAAGLVHGFFASIWDTVSGIAKMIYEIVHSIISGELRSDIMKLVEGLKGLSGDKINEMLGEWAAKWDEKLNSSSQFIAGHAHGYLTGYVMAEVAMLLLTGGVATELKAAFWASRIGKAIKVSRPFVVAQEVTAKAIEAGGKVAEVVDKVRKSRAGVVVKAADVVVTVAGWTAEMIGKVLSLPGNIAVYVIDKALANAKKLGPYFERIGKFGERAKKWIFGCFSPCTWEADAVTGVLKRFTDDEIKVLADSANGARLLQDKWLEKSLKVGDKLPEGYHWRDGQIVRSPGKREANYAPLVLERDSGKLKVGLAGERISNPSAMNRNYKEFVKQELKAKNPNWGDKKLNAEVAKEVEKNAVHHLIPDNKIQDHPLGVAARKAGYDLDRGNNLQGLKKTEKLTDVDAGDIGHWSSHPNYDKIVEGKLTKVQKALEKEFGSLDKVPKSRMLEEMKKVEDELRELFKTKNVPIDPDTGRLTELSPQMSVRAVEDAYV